MRILLTGILLAMAAVAHASAPYAERPPNYDAQADRLSVACVGLVEDAATPLAARRQAVTGIATRRATEALHAFVDVEMARLAYPPWVAAAVHAALQADTTERRLFADGGVVVEVVAAVEPMRLVAAREGLELPWSR